MEQLTREIYSQGEWQGIGDVFAGDLVDIQVLRAEHVARFRVRGITDATTTPMSLESVFFGVDFDQAGELLLTLTELDALGNPVPEPRTWRMLVGGLLLLAWHISKIGRVCRRARNKHEHQA